MQKKIGISAFLRGYKYFARYAVQQKNLSFILLQLQQNVTVFI